jgi:hypothetical protein
MIYHSVHTVLQFFFQIFILPKTDRPLKLDWMVFYKNGAVLLIL